MAKEEAVSGNVAIGSVDPDETAGEKTQPELSSISVTPDPGEETDETGAPEVEPEETAAEESEPEAKAEGKSKQQEWDKERQKADQARAEAEKKLAEREKEMSDLKSRLDQLESTKPTPQEASEELSADDEIPLIDEVDDYDPDKKDPTKVAHNKLAKAFNAKLKMALTKVEEIEKANAERSEKEKLSAEQVANKNAYQQLLDGAVVGDDSKASWEGIRNPLDAAVRKAFESEGFDANNIPSPQTTKWIVEAEARRLKSEALIDEAKKAASKKSPSEPKKGVAIPTESATPKRSLGLKERASLLKERGLSSLMKKK